MAGEDALCGRRWPEPEPALAPTPTPTPATASSALCPRAGPRARAGSGRSKSGAGRRSPIIPGQHRQQRLPPPPPAAHLPLPRWPTPAFAAPGTRCTDHHPRPARSRSPPRPPSPSRVRPWRSALGAAAGGKRRDPASWSV